MGGTKQAAGEELLSRDQLACLERQIQRCLPPSLHILQRRLRQEEMFCWSLPQEKDLAHSYFYLICTCILGFEEKQVGGKL